MKTTLSVMAAAGLLAAPAAQAQDAANVFKPAGQWTADYGDDYCRLIRTFSNGTAQVSLALERTQPGTATRVILVGDAIKAFRGSTELGYALLPTGGEQKAMFVRSQTPDGQQYLSFDLLVLAPPVPPTAGAPGFTPPPPGTPPVIPPYNRTFDQDSAGKVSAIGLGEGLTAPVRIDTGSLKAPIAAMQACADDLLKLWGLDPDKHKAMSALPVMAPNPDGVLPQGTIPFDQFDKFGGGANQVRLLIGADGKPTACTIYAPSLSQSLNDKICKLAMARASFQPAKDAGGQPMASYWMGSPMFLGPPFPGGRGPGR